MGSAVVGLIAGLMIVIPTVLWLSGFPGTDAEFGQVVEFSVGEANKITDHVRKR
jgi:hypothetical protein